MYQDGCTKAQIGRTLWGYEFGDVSEAVRRGERILRRRRCLDG